MAAVKVDCFIVTSLSKSKRGKIFTIFFSIMIILVTIQLSSVSAYEEVTTFNEDSSLGLNNCSRIVWYLDFSSGHSSPPALRSGPVRNGGVSCVAKIVDGPASINFWWKVDPETHRVGILSFLVDNQIIFQCSSSDWSSVAYAVPPGNHTLSWEYKKFLSYPEYTGTGWIDDLMIGHPSLQRPSVVETPKNLTCCDSIILLKENLDRVEDKIPAIEEKLAKINESIEGINGTIEDINRRIEDINNNYKLIANLSYKQTTSEDLSWINKHVVYISDKNTNLSEVINKSENKIIILDDGIYHIGGLSITKDNVNIRSLRKWGATLDANGANNGIIIETAKNVTVDSVVINNCTDGFHIENSTDCNIINNLIINFKEIGIHAKNITQCTFMFNRLEPLENDGTMGIKLMLASKNNMLMFNEINISESDNDSYLYAIYSSKDNFIYVSNDGRILEDGAYCDIWNCESGCKWLINDTKVDLKPISKNMWSFLD